MRRLLFALIVFVSLPVKGQVRPVTDGLTFYAGFERSLGPDNCRGGRAATGTYKAGAGRVGQGFINGGGGVWYVCPGNLNRNKGSISFWVRPEARIGSIANDTTIFTTAEPDSMKLVYIQKHQVFYWLTVHTPSGKDWTWDWSLSIPADSIPEKGWTHVVLTWDKRLPEDVEGPILGGTRTAQKKVYLNGRLVGSKEMPDIDGRDEGSFNIGGGIPGVYDEVVVWDRVLAMAQIKQLYERPEATAEVARKLPPMAKEKEWRVYPELVYFNYADSLVSPGETITVKTPLVNRTDREQSGTLTLTRLDVWERPQGKPVEIAFKLAGKAKGEFPARFTCDCYGAFKIQATVAIGDHKESRDITSFACIPAGIPPKHIFFGGHINQGPNMPEMARRLGFAAHRGHNMTQFTWWKLMEPHRGDWMMIDRGLYENLIQRDFYQMGQWFGSPYWSVKFADGTSPPAPANLMEYPQGWMPTDLAAYQNYVRESVKRHPVIREWEVWNEPWSSFFFKGSVEEYVKLCELSSKAAREVDPKLTIWAQFVDNVWGKAILKAGVLKYCDGLSYHGYVDPGRWDDALRMIRTIRDIVKDLTGRENVLLSNSEAGIKGTTFLRGLDFPELPPEARRGPMTFRESAERIVQYYVTAMSEGVTGWYYYFHQPVGEANSYLSWSTVEVTRTPKPFAVALCQLAWQLDGGKYVTQTKLQGPVYAYLFDRKDGESTAAVWCVDRGEADVKLDVRTFDLMGNEIKHTGTVRVTDSPMYLRFKGKSEAFVRALNEAAVTVVKEPVKPAEAKPAAAPAPKKMEDFAQAKEFGEARLIALDLKDTVNMGLADDKASDGVGGWTDEGPFNDMRDLKPGKHNWLGVPFVVIDPKANGGKAVLTLKGNTFPSGPAKGPTIPVGRKVEGFFFAHAANYAQVKGAPAGAYTVTYEDGKTQTAPIVIGSNVYDWWNDWQDGEDSRTVAVRAPDALGGKDQDRFIRIWYWKNPRPEQPVKSIMMATQPGSPAAMVLVAITAGVK